MKVLAAIQADFETTPIGTRSRLADELRGLPILRRTVDRLRQVESVEGVFVLCPSSQRERCAALIAGTGVEVRPHDAAPPPWGGLVRSARKWSLDSWRGGIGGTTVFDEYTDCRLLEGLLRAVPGDAVLVVPPAAVVFDPRLADDMIRHRKTSEDETRLVFTPGPPGIAGILLDAALIGELAAQNLPIGWLFSYQPDSPRKDLIFEPSCLDAPSPVRFASGRLIADTDRAVLRLTDLLDAGCDGDAVTIANWLLRREESWVDPLPREVEVELTTDDPYPDAVLRPRGARLSRRGPLDVSILRRLADELSQFDDSLLVLGGIGDPLRHPNFEEILELLRPRGRCESGVYGVCVRTTGVDLTDERIAELIDHDVDLLTVILDAWSPDLYGRLQCPHHPQAARLEHVLETLDRLSQTREGRGSPRPIVVPELTKSRDNVRELDAFYDGWLRRAGAVSVIGASHLARQAEDYSVINMAPSPRRACRRISSRCVVLADGRVTACDQDFHGSRALGDLGAHSLRDLWTGKAIRDLRTAHREGRFDALPLCAACDEWHRP